MTTVTDNGAGTVVGPLTEPKVTDLSLSSNKLRLVWEWRGLLFTPNNVSVVYIREYEHFSAGVVRGKKKLKLCHSKPVDEVTHKALLPRTKTARRRRRRRTRGAEELGCQQDCYSLFTLSSVKHIILNLLIFLFLFCSESVTRAKCFVCWLRPGGNNIFHNIA